MENSKIEKQNFNTEQLENEYYNCTFENCDFSEMKIDDVNFEDCEFKSCNFSLSKLFNVFRDSKFIECKMTGVDFSCINKFALSFSFEKCILSYASFIGIKMKNTIFIECELNETAFDNANITSSIFNKCDLTRASFFDTNLEKVNFSTSYNFSINPNHSKLKKAIFSETNLRGLLSHLDINIVESD